MFANQALKMSSQQVVKNSSKKRVEIIYQFGGLMIFFGIQF